MWLIILLLLIVGVQSSYEDVFLNDTSLYTPFRFFEWQQQTVTPPSLLETHVAELSSSHPMLLKWDDHWNRSVFLQRTPEQVLKLQTNMLRDHILRHMYASTHMMTRIRLPSYTTRPSLCSIRMELKERGFKSRIGDDSTVWSLFSSFIDLFSPLSRDDMPTWIEVDVPQS